MGDKIKDDDLKKAHEQLDSLEMTEPPMEKAGQQSEPSKAAVQEAITVAIGRALFLVEKMSKLRGFPLGLVSSSPDYKSQHIGLINNLKSLINDLEKHPENFGGITVLGVEIRRDEYNEFVGHRVVQHSAGSLVGLGLCHLLHRFEFEEYQSAVSQILRITDEDLEKQTK